MLVSLHIERERREYPAGPSGTQGLKARGRRIGAWVSREKTGRGYKAFERGAMKGSEVRACREEAGDKVR